SANVHTRCAHARVICEDGQKPYRRGRDSSCGDALMQTTGTRVGRAPRCGARATGLSAQPTEPVGGPVLHHDALLEPSFAERQARHVFAGERPPQLVTRPGAAQLAPPRLVARQVPGDALETGIAGTGEGADCIPRGGRDPRLAA